MKALFGANLNNNNHPNIALFCTLPMLYEQDCAKFTEVTIHIIHCYVRNYEQERRKLFVLYNRTWTRISLIWRENKPFLPI